jgi:hypothetical protein
MSMSSKGIDSPPRKPLAWREFGVAVVVAFSLSGCAPTEGDSISASSFRNDLDVPVLITYAAHGAERQVLGGEAIPAGERRDIDLIDLVEVNDDGNWCTAGDLIVRTEEGTEVARLPPPVCERNSYRLSDYATR